MDIKSRLRNRPFIVSVIGFGVLLYRTFTKHELPSNFDLIVNTGLGILTTLGILIDPSTPGIRDNKNVKDINKELK